MTKITIGSRKSKLAMWQSCYVQKQLNQKGFETEIVTMETKGDKILNTSIAKIGSKGVFTEELEQQLANGAIDIAVHSAKDMPSRLPTGFSLIAFTEREKPEDVLVSHNSALDIEDSSQKIVIGTSSVRRRAILCLYYPHVQTIDIRGNLQTRIQKMKDGLCDAIMLAYAGVHRMNMENMIVKVFPLQQFIPPVGQGCIAIEASTTLSAEKMKKIRDCVNNQASEACILAERAFLKKLEGGCSIPAFALALYQNGNITLTGGLVSLDGSKIIKNNITGTPYNAVALGEKLGSQILADGGSHLLAEIRAQQAGE